jgi:hypothetical protein
MKGWLAALLLVAVVAGVAGGLYYAWMVSPVEVQDTTPGALRAGDKLLYLALVGDLYAFEDDLERAEKRLAELGLPPDGAVVAGFVEQHLDAGGQPEDVRNLARLAEALGASGGVVAVFAGPSPVPTVTPTVGAAPTPTLWSTATPAPTFLLIEQAERCAAPGRPGLIAVIVRDAAGQEMAGVQVLVSWSGGQDRFWTGLRPAQGAGYADFQMAPGTAYDVALAAFASESARGLTSALSPGLCGEGVDAVDWRLVFQQVP